MERKSNSIVISPKRRDLEVVFKELGLDFFKDIGNFMYCPTGEAYWTVVSDGIKKEGSSARLFNSEREAIEAWNDRIKQIAGDLAGKATVYWRRKPEMRFFWAPDGDFGRWMVYSRFRISSKPIIQSADYNKVNPVAVEDLPDAKMGEGSL